MIHLHQKITSKELQFPLLHITKHSYQKTFFLSSTPFHILYYHLNTPNAILPEGSTLPAYFMQLCRLNCFFCPCLVMDFISPCSRPNLFGMTASCSSHN